MTILIFITSFIFFKIYKIKMNSNYKKPELAKPQFVCKNIIN